MQAKRTIRLPLATLALLSMSVAFGQTAYVAGPVERASLGGDQVAVLGQTYLIDSKTVFTASGRSISTLTGARLLQSGVLIGIESTPSVAPRVASSITFASTQYVAGASAVSLGGTVIQVDRDFGKVKIGDLVVDISAARPEVLSQLEIGSFVEIYGVQPVPQGLLLAQEILVRPLAGLAPAGTDASAQSIGGTGSKRSLQSIGGTGTGASLQSIGGTGTGASVQSIGGTGSKTSLQSIGGTGTGASVQSIGGTGSKTSLQSIGGTGTGASVQSIGGTGSKTSLQSIGGTGTGTSLQSIGGTGTGASVQSIGGTGSKTSLQSIGGTGTGASVQSIGGTGSNVSLQSIGGTGRNAS